MSNIHFVHDNEPGTPLDTEQTRALRSHVRKVNLERLQQRTTQRMENFRSLSIDDFSQHGEIKPEKRRFPVRFEVAATEASSSNALQSDKGPPVPRAERLATLAATEGPESLSGTIGGASAGLRTGLSLEVASEDEVLRSTTTRHLYSAQISAMTGIHENLAESLLSSGAFRVATEPLLTAEHQTPDLMHLSIFPDLLENRAFLSALIYSMLQSPDYSTSATKGLHFKGRAIQCLQEDLHKNGSTCWTLAICTILVLCGAARHSGEISEYTAHAEGLDRLVRLCHSSQVQLPSDILRAVLWLDLTGAGILGDRRRFSEDDFSALLNIDTNLLSCPHDELPYGFTFHGDIIHHDLLSCIERIKSLQSTMATSSLEAIKADNMRASITSRLVSLQQTCQGFGPISEGCRVAAYIICDACIDRCGKSSFVGSRLSESLTRILAESIGSEEWAYRRDLLLWLVLVVGASASRAGGWFGSGDDSPYRDLMERLLHNASTWAEKEEGSFILRSTVQGYIYDQDWLDKRHLIPHWMDLEKLLTQSEIFDARASGS
ncbi:hypothetical protein EDD37DRAFT_458923 [Exophiala viscosa]|uniref:uncharacterized protein n=1 Tax=Exophiala viscosa TaxID=2486360 RepID=UPI0021A09790|nr:hypothetical protein EDD37DRAFT_458923 [Exophiala viscosa]